jgi:hypothetical protein
MRTKTFIDNDVVNHLRDGHRMILMTTIDGTKSWFVVPGGPVQHDVAHAVLAREDVHGVHDDQWPGHDQVYAYRRAA